MEKLWGNVHLSLSAFQQFWTYCLNIVRYLVKLCKLKSYSVIGKNLVSIRINLPTKLTSKESLHF